MQLNTFPEIFSQNSNAIGSHEYLTCPPTWWKNSPPTERNKESARKKRKPHSKAPLERCHLYTPQPNQSSRNRDPETENQKNDSELDSSLILSCFEFLPLLPTADNVGVLVTISIQIQRRIFFSWGDLDEEMRFGTKVLGLFLKWVCTVGGKFCEVSQIEWKDGL